MSGSRLGLAWWLGVAALVGCGCSSSSTAKPASTSRRAPATSAPVTQPTTAPSAATTSTVAHPSSSTTVSTTTTTQPAPNPAAGAKTVAEQYVRNHGFTPIGPSDFTLYPDPNALHVIVAVVTNSGTGYADRAFFFVGGRIVGTDTTDTSATIREAWRVGDSIALYYTIYKADDPNCCPLGGAVIVRFHWTGTHLVPLDPIPSFDARR